jgi:type II secretory pathway predicted ATPase ExeA
MLIYNNFFGFDHSPFSSGIPTSNLFVTDSQQEALDRLKYVAQQKMFATVTGDCGTGKTTVLRKLKDSLDEKKYEFLYITDSKLSPRGFYNEMLQQLGREGAFYRGDCRRKLHQEIELIDGVRHRRLVIVVDEAHLLDKEMLTELRFLLNFKMDSESPLALILSGQSELEENISKRSNEAIKQRIDFRCRLDPLTLAETGLYIAHHLQYAGTKDAIFSESAVKEIFAFSAGSARLINKTCSSSLLYCYYRKVKEIDEIVVREIIQSEFK